MFSLVDWCQCSQLFLSTNPRVGKGLPGEKWKLSNCAMKRFWQGRIKFILSWFWLRKLLQIKIPKAKFLLSRLRLWNPRPLSMVSIYNRYFPYFSVLKISLLIFMLLNNNYAGTPVFVSTLSWSWTRHLKCFHEAANGTWWGCPICSSSK